MTVLQALKQFEDIVSKFEFDYDNNYKGFTSDSITLKKLTDYIFTRNNSDTQDYKYKVAIVKIIDKARKNFKFKMTDSEINYWLFSDYKETKTYKNKPVKKAVSNITISDIKNALENFDWAYSMADSSNMGRSTYNSVNVGARGRKRQEEIGKMIDEFIDSNPRKMKDLKLMIKSVFDHTRRMFLDPVDFSKKLKGL